MCILNIVFFYFSQTAKLVLDEYFLGDSEQFGSGIEYFTFDEKPVSSDNNLSQTPLTPSNTVSLGRELSMDSAATSESEETYKSHLATELQSSDQGI